MKVKLCILTILIALSFPEIAQSQSEEYIPMAEDHNRWIVKLTSINGSWSILDLWEYYANGDTSINEVDYIKIYRRDLVVTYYGPPYEPESNYELYGFIRDDITEQKVYGFQLIENGVFEGCELNEEYLMYDFNLEIDDTISSCLFPEFYDNIITDIQPSTYFGYETDAFIGNPFTYMEGIGSEFGLFEVLFDPLKKEENQIDRTYLADFCRQDSCSLIVSNHSPDFNRDFVISPNPARGFVKITPPSFSHISFVTISDILGNVMVRKPVSHDEKNIIIQTGFLSQGIYLLSIHGKNKRVYTKKILIQ